MIDEQDRLAIRIAVTFTIIFLVIMYGAALKIIFE